MERIQSFRDQVRRENQQEGSYPLCRGCGWLEKRVWGKQAYPFNHLTIAHFTECNLQCNYCYVTQGGFHAEPAKPYDVYPILESMIREKLLSPKVYVFWGGGEPTIFKDFKRSFELLMNYGAEQAVSTNATLMSEELKRGLLRRKVSLVCSVDAGSKATYKRIKNRDFFDQVWRNLAEYASTGGRVDAKIIVMEENHHEIIPFLDLAVRAGIRNIVYDVNFHVQEHPDEIVDAIALLHYEGTLKRGLRIIEGGSGVPAFGNELRERIRRRLDEIVTWEDVAGLKKQIQKSRAMRFSRELQRYPRLLSLAEKTYAFVEEKYRRFRPGFY